METPEADRDKKPSPGDGFLVVCSLSMPAASLAAAAAAAASLLAADAGLLAAAAVAAAPSCSAAALLVLEARETTEATLCSE